MVNSNHHQGIREISDKLTAMAFAADGLTEAAYMPNRCFVGVFNGILNLH